MKNMKIGDTYEARDTVNETNVASAVGSGLLEVYSTPCLIALMENAASLCIAPSLPEGKGSVGVHIEVDHVSATPIGMAVRAVAKISAISENGKSVDFEVEAYDEAGLIGKGVHTRAIINNERFMERCQRKLETA